MKKKLIAVLITLAMVISMIPMVVFSAQEEEPETGGASNLVLPKKVIWDNEKWDIVTYLNVNLDLELDTADIEAILADISFFIYESNADGDLLDEVEGVTGKILPGTSTISFADKDGPYEFEAGWYVAEEVLGDIAAEYFVDSGATLHFYFNKLTGTVTAGPGAVFDEDTYFTIEQFKDKSRYVHAIYKDEDGVIRTLRTVPPFALPNGMIGGGGSILGTSRFVATQNTGEEFMSFCSDIGAISVKGKYYVDEKNQGMTQEQLLRLIAAVDFVYTRGGFVDYEDIALAQLVVWNLVLEYTNNPMVADGWIQDRDNRITYPEAWGDLIKIEGINHKGPFDWHCEDYRSLIDDILDHAYDDKYVDIYNERIADGADSFVSSGFFLVGDGSFANFEQQLQFTITFGAPVTFDNEPEADKYMGLSILKVVTEDGKSEWISVWLNDVKGLDFDEVEEILDDIEFKLYTSNAAGIEIEEVEGVVGKIDLNTSKITFYKAGVVYDLPTGWYLVREFLGPLAAGYFSSPVPDLHIHFNSKSGAVTPGAGPVFPDDAIFSVEQFKEHSRPLQALFIDEDGVINILKGTAPYLDVPGNIGGGAFGTSRFEVTHKNGDKSKYMSFCADIGAVECYGDYVIDKNNHGFTQEQLLRLVAVIDFIYARSAFADYEDIALAQLAVWNLILEYTDDPMTADLWLQSAGVLYKDVWGKLFKIEGVSEHNGVEYWYITPGYKELIDDIIANAYNDKYVNLYYERIASEVDKYVGAAYFLKGLVGENEEENFPEHLQQRQLMITFNGPVTFNNIPDEGEKQGKIYIDKFVDGDDTGIATWLILEKDMELAKVQALLDDITFELYNSNADGDVLAKVAGVVGEIDILNSVISFLDVTETPPVLYEASTGWYIVREVMGDEAKKFFKDGIDDLHIYFVSETEDVLTGPDGERAVFDNESLKNGGLNISAAANLQHRQASTRSTGRANGRRTSTTSNQAKGRSRRPTAPARRRSCRTATTSATPRLTRPLSPTASRWTWSSGTRSTKWAHAL